MAKKASKKTAKTAKKVAKKTAKKTVKKTAKKVAKKTATKTAKKVAKKSSTVKPFAAQSAVAGPGKSVADLSVKITDGRELKLSELTGARGLVLYFYPKDSTPGCTTEACDFRDNLARVQSLGFGVVGVSPDSLKSHAKFSENQNINFPLIADEDKALAGPLGVWGEKKLYGRAFMGIKRTTFLLDKSLKILKTYENVKVNGHVDQVMSDIKEL